MLVSTLSLALGLGFATLSSCNPVANPIAMPQVLDLDALDDAPPAPVATINPVAPPAIVVLDKSQVISAAVAAPLVKPDDPSAKVKRQTGTCAAQPVGSGTAIRNPDSDTAFTGYAGFSNAANLATTPAGYTNSFTDLQAASQALGYLGYNTVGSYDPSLCAARCNAIVGCNAFNIYFERDPSQDPGTLCPNPPSTTNIKCAYFSGPVTRANALNTGQYRNQFHVVIAGSNGYVKTSPPVSPPYNPVTSLGNAAIQAPLCRDGSDPYLGYKLFNDGYFIVDRCAAACTDQALSSSPRKCAFFNTYILYRNGVSVGQYCSLYTSYFAPSYATNTGYTSGMNVYTIGSSYSTGTTKATTCV